MFLWRSLQPDALTLVLRYLAGRDRQAAAAVAPQPQGDPRRGGQAGPAQDGRVTLITPKT